MLEIDSSAAFAEVPMLIAPIKRLMEAAQLSVLVNLFTTESPIHVGVNRLIKMISQRFHLIVSDDSPL